MDGFFCGVGGVLVLEGTSDISPQWVLQDRKHKHSVLLIIIIIIIILCYSVHLFNGKNSLPRNLGRFLPRLKVWIQEGDFKLCLPEVPGSLRCITSDPVFTQGGDVGWGRKRLVWLAASLVWGWHPPRAIKQSLAHARKQAVHPSPP